MSKILAHCQQAPTNLVIVSMLCTRPLKDLAVFIWNPKNKVKCAEDQPFLFMDATVVPLEMTVSLQQPDVQQDVLSSTIKID